MLVNFFPLSVASIFELQYTLNEGRNLADNSSIIQLCLGLTLNFIMNIFILGLVTYVVIRHHLVIKETRLYTIKHGLNEARRFWMVLYYFIYFGIRFLIILLIGLTHDVPSIILWSILVFVQTIFVIFNIFKMMKSCYF